MELSMKKNRENHMALLFMLGAAGLAAFFLFLAYILFFKPEFILVVLRYAAAVLTSVFGIALAVYAIKLIRRYIHMRE